MKFKPGVPKIDELFIIDGGDGDQDFFSEPKILKLIETDWFSGIIRRGEAMLLVINEGRRAGQYVALTSKTLVPLQEQIIKNGWASIVVHIITNPTSSFDGSDDDAFPIGMSVVYRM